MDVCYETLPTESASLYQSSSDMLRMTDGEAFIYNGGGVGIFGEVGTSDATIKPDRWHRIVITVGPEQLEIKPMNASRTPMNASRTTMNESRTTMNESRTSSHSYNERRRRNDEDDYDSCDDSDEYLYNSMRGY
jgi:hypothetical protein